MPGRKHSSCSVPLVLPNTVQAFSWAAPPCGDSGDFLLVETIVGGKADVDGSVTSESVVVNDKGLGETSAAPCAHAAESGPRAANKMPTENVHLKQFIGPYQMPYSFVQEADSCGTHGKCLDSAYRGPQTDVDYGCCGLARFNQDE